MQKISKSLEELVQEKLLSKKAADIAPNTPKTPNVANTAPKTSTMEDGTYYLEPSKDDPNKMVGKIWGKRPTDPEALKRYQETFERTYAMNHPLQKATQQWGKNIGYGKNYTDSAQIANRKLRQEEIGGAENVDQAGDSTFTRLRKGWNRAKAQNNLPEMRRYQNQMNTEWANYARAAGLKTPKDLLGKLSKEQMAQINAANVQAMFPDMQRWTVAGDKFDANALAKQKNIYIPKIEDIKIKDALEGFAGAGKGAPEDIAKRRQEIYNERIEAMRKAYANDPEKLYLFEKALGNNINKTIKGQGTPATEEQKKQLVAQKEKIQNAANVAQDAYTKIQNDKQQVSNANIVTDPEIIRYLNNARGIPGQFGITGSIYNFFTKKDKDFKLMPNGHIRDMVSGKVYQPRGNEYEEIDPPNPQFMPRVKMLRLEEK